MIKKFFAAVILTALLVFAQNVSAQPEFSCRANVQDLGWLQAVGNGEVAGTTGQARRMEALVINFDGGIQYSAHVQNIGWQGWVAGGQVAGTLGKDLRMEAIRIQLTGQAEKYFDVYYRAHVQNGGWLGWAMNGEPAGTAGAALQMEAVQIVIVEKGKHVEHNHAPAFYQHFPNAPTA